MSLPFLGIRRLLGAGCNYRLSSTWHWTTKSYLRPLRVGLRSDQYSSFEEHTGSESPPLDSSSDMKYDRGRRALPLLSPLPVDIMDFLPISIPLPIPVPVLSKTISTSEYPPSYAMAENLRGRRKGNTADFIARAIEKHGDQYDYSLSEYGKTAHDKVVILCTRHDPPVAFEMSPNTHLSGSGCRVCWLERSRGSTADFIARAVAIHGDLYDYSLTEYGNSCEDKVVIVCTRHDPPVAFEMSPANHLNGHGCRLCGIARAGQKKRRSTADFIARAVEIHGDQYDYSLSEYGKTNADKVVIRCRRHEPPLAFKMSPNSHLSGQGCRACGIARTSQKLRSNTAAFIARAVKKHGDLYDYSLSEYGKTNHVKVVIICKRHNPPLKFEMSPRNHLQGRGCHACGFESRMKKR
jgi:hypothetical protein